MRVYRADIRWFRGFAELRVLPESHVALVGEPRSGRSTLVEALRRVLTPDASRLTTPDELDFLESDTSRRAEVEVVLGALGADLEQDFFDHLEAWDIDEGDLLDERPPTATADDENIEWVLRLCYRIEWDEEQERAEHWVDFPAESDPSIGRFARIPRRLHELLPVVAMPGDGPPLRLSPRSVFRRLVQAADDDDDLRSALDDLVASVSDAGEALAKTDLVKGVLESVLGPLAGPLGIDPSDDELVRFLPEGGSLSGVLRSMRPALDLGEAGHLPLHRHGSTVGALVQVGEALAGLSASGAVVLYDDFGEGLDSLSASHLGSLLRKRADQVWLSTRRSAAVESFRPTEVVRMHRDDGERKAARLDGIRTRAERIAARHLFLQLLPAASACSVAILEGPHDRAAIEALAQRRLRERGKRLPASYGVAIIDAGVVDGSGGSPGVVRLSEFAARLGFHTIAILDGDKGDAATVAEARAVAHRVIRLPDGCAIEKAIFRDLDDEHIRDAIRSLCATYAVEEPRDLDTLGNDALVSGAAKVLKKSGGLHAQAVNLLPPRVHPPLLTGMLDAIVVATEARLDGLDQL